MTERADGRPLLICEADRDVGRLVIVAARRFGLDPLLYEGSDHGCEIARAGRSGAQIVLICGTDASVGCARHAHLAKPFTLSELEGALREAAAKAAPDQGTR
jgi:hypothetical protein